MPRGPNWSYMLRIPGASPRTLRMDRLAEYLKEFAELLGLENKPVFVGIKDASIGLKSNVPPTRRQHVWKRLQEGKYKPNSRPAKQLAKIQELLGKDHFDTAELKDNCDNVIHLFRAEEPTLMQAITIRQHGEMDGVVTGLKGADDTMHLYVRDELNRDHSLVVRDEALARELLQLFRNGMIRIRLHGSWTRTVDGWVPESGKCVVDGYETLDESPLSNVMATIAALPDNGWSRVDDPEAVWRDIRGIH